MFAAKHELCDDEKTMPCPRKELSSRLKDVILELGVCESIIQDVTNNVKGNTFPLADLPEPESHYQSVESLEIMAARIKSELQDLQDLLR